MYGLVVRKDGSVVHVATFGAKGIPARMDYNGLVVHQGDVTRPTDSVAREILKITFDDSILAVVIVAYSAQSNGNGSFKHYQVGLKIDNGAGDIVEVSASNANDDDIHLRPRHHLQPARRHDGRAAGALQQARFRTSSGGQAQPRRSGGSPHGQGPEERLQVTLRRKPPTAWP